MVYLFVVSEELGIEGNIVLKMRYIFKTSKKADAYIEAQKHPEFFKVEAVEMMDQNFVFIEKYTYTNEKFIYFTFIICLEKPD